jgi:hypothetical protein
MNVTRALKALQNINEQLKQPQNYETLKALKRGQRKWKRELEQFTNQHAHARPLPTRNANQLNLI